jgi:integrase/recombinase XerD
MNGVNMNKPKPKSRENVLTEEEIEMLKAACKTEEEKLVVYGLLYTGMRISEYIHLNKQWINTKTDPPSIKIPYEMKCNCYECKKAHGKKPAGMWRAKTKHAERVIPILPEVDDILYNYFLKHNSIMETIPTRIYAWKIVKEVAKRAKIKHPIFPHCIRATFATIVAKKGFDAIYLQHVMGWKQLSMAQEYVRLSGSAILDEFKRKW